MQVIFSRDLEALVEKHLATGAYADVEDLFRCALTRLAEEEQSLTPDEVAHIEEGYRQGLRGEVKTGEQVRLDMVEFKKQWIREHTVK